jgi:hypothetical protein
MTWIQQGPVDAVDVPLRAPSCSPGELSLKLHSEILLLDRYRYCCAQRVPGRWRVTFCSLRPHPSSLHTARASGNPG